jgi:hypothetical protein
MISNEENLSLQLRKLSNGSLRIENAKWTCYSSVLKSGCRYNDERAVLNQESLLESKLELIDLDAKVK